MHVREVNRVRISSEGHGGQQQEGKVISKAGKPLVGHPGHQSVEGLSGGQECEMVMEQERRSKLKENELF